MRFHVVVSRHNDGTVASSSNCVPGVGVQAGSDLVGWAQVCMPVNLSHEDHELCKLDVATEQQVSVGSYQLTCLQSHLHCPGAETRKSTGTCTLLKGLSPLC